MTLPFGPDMRHGGTDIKPLAADRKVYQTTLDFWLAPFMLLRCSAVFYWEHQNGGRAVYMECGYDELSDLEATVSQEEIDKLIQDGWIKEYNYNKAELSILERLKRLFK